MKIGLLSDTHSHLDPQVISYFKDCHEIWHAGDIGDMSVARQLEAFKPLRAVHGNIDDKTIRDKYPEDLWFEIEGLNIWITHIGGTPPHYNPRVAGLLSTRTPDVLICGHSHMLKVARDPKRNNLLFLNPGASGNHGFHQIKTILRFEINQGKVDNMEAIELGKRGQIGQTSNEKATPI